MIPFIFTLFGLGTGAGLYFILVGLGVLLFVAASPVVAVYGIYRFVHAAFTERAADETREILLPRGRDADRVDVAMPSDLTVSDTAAGEMIRKIEVEEVDQLLEMLPSVNHHELHFSRDGALWQVQFRLNSFAAHFDVVGAGATPEIAFARVKDRMIEEIKEWHSARQEGRPYIAKPPIMTGIAVDDASDRRPTVLIVEDDIDMAIGLRSVFQRLGCKVNVATEMNFAHENVSARENDFIVLDWMLGANLSGGQVVDRAIRAIDAAPDLQDRFTRKPTVIITYSTLEREQVAISKSPYFEHVEHWHKSVGLRELEKRSFQLIQAYAA